MTIRFTVSVSHIDTCFPDALTDHHNREGEFLVGVHVGPASTNESVKSELIEEWESVEPVGLDAYNSTEETADFEKVVLAAIDDFFDDDPAALFAGIPDEIGDGDDETPQAWFLFTWEAEEVSVEVEPPMFDTSELVIIRDALIVAVKSPAMSAVSMEQFMALMFLVGKTARLIEGK